ncbi:MAG: 5'-deoxynucleotidase [Ruminococcaceae bacterium]|nr:5'-deoxynucleotidase [Oscillospiraceae bacterium]
MSHHFYAMLSRMKNIYRWGLMRNTKQENLSEHSLEVAFIAHALAVIRNRRLGGNINPTEVAVAAMFHDTTEIITGDMPTPIKYYNPEIRDVYKQIEAVASDRLLSMLPEDLREDFKPFYYMDNDTARLIKAADKLSALIKCTEELNMGNREFAVAKESTLKAVKAMHLPEVEIFLNEFIESFSLPLDEQGNS